MATSSQGTTFSFASSTFTAVSVTVTKGGDLLDASHLGLANGEGREYTGPALKDDEVAVESFGTTALAIGATGAISMVGVTGDATVSSSSVVFSVGELILQSTTFKFK